MQYFIQTALAIFGQQALTTCNKRDHTTKGMSGIGYRANATIERETPSARPKMEALDIGDCTFRLSRADLAGPVEDFVYLPAHLPEAVPIFRSPD